MHRAHDSKIESQQAGNNSPDSLTYGYPDDRNETQIKMIITTVPGSEHHPENGNYRQALAKDFRERTKSERSFPGMRSGWVEVGGWRQPVANMWKYMN